MIAAWRKLSRTIASWLPERWRSFPGAGPAANRWAARYRSDRHREAIELADSAHQYFDEQSASLGNAATIQGQRREIACKAGCSHCCSLYVSATVSELLLIEGFIAELPAKARDSIKHRVEDACDQAKGLNMAQRDRVRIRCPMLSQRGTCEVYPARPLTCRSYVSFDLPACKADAERPGQGIRVSRSGSLIRMRSALFEQLVKQERQRGYAANSFELIQGMHELLSSERAVEDFCSGVDPAVDAHSR